VPGNGNFAQFDEKSNPSVVLTEHVSRKRRLEVEMHESIQFENSIESEQPPVRTDYE
jgi:hypothetical protein